MRKTSSTGNLFDNSNKNRFNKIHKKLQLKNNMTIHQNPNEPSTLRKSKVIFASKVKNLGDNSNIFSSSTLSINNRPNIFDSSLSNNQAIFSNEISVQRKLYDELMVLKKKVNFLNAQIALEKSSKRKKDVQISTKARQIKSYQSDIKMSKDIAPVNIDKLKNSNIISHLKKEFQTAKLSLNAKRNETKNMEAFLKKAKPNILRQENLLLEQKLKEALKEYKELLELNAINSKKINEMEGLHEIFVKNHEKIEKLRQRKENLEKNINFLQENINLMNEANYKNEETLMKQNKNKLNYNRHIEHLMKEKKNKEEILKMKMTYKQQINKLEEEEKEFRDKYSNNERQIKDLKENIYLVEKMMKIDPLKIKTFDYSKIKEMEHNPNDVINSKILLLQSLINESNSNKKQYQEIINTYIYRFNELGYDYTQLDKPQNEQEKQNNNEEKKEGEENKEDKKEEGNNDNNQNANNENNNANNNINNKGKKEENEDIVNFNNNTENNKNENNKDGTIENNNANNLDNPDLKKDNPENIDKDNLVSFDKNKNNNINNNTQDLKSQEEKTGTDNNNNLPEENKNEKNDIHSLKTEEIKESGTIQEDKKNELKSNSLENKDIKLQNPNDLMKEKLDAKKLLLENKNTNALTNEEFTEFTYILIKNFESKKIGEETARQKIIMIPSTKDPLDDNKFIEQMSFNIMKSVHCDHKESLEKVKKWLVTLFILCSNDQKKVTENFLTLFGNITIYTPEQEIILSKKVKKSFINKKEEIYKKYNAYKDTLVNFEFMKKLIEDEKVAIKDEYVQYLFYEMKRFEDPSKSLYDLKMKNFFDILDNNENESKMDTESDIEITNEEYVSIITGFGTQLLNYLEKNHTDLRTVLGDIVQNLSGEESTEKIEVVFIEPFVNKMKEIGIELNDEIKIYCLFSRYKLSDEYEIISVNLLEKELENSKNSKINYSNEINAISPGLGSNINDINNINEIGPSYKNKVMEKVQEENEENVSV